MKTVHWQIPFASINNTRYRIDIYAEGNVAAPVILTGAATPFTTDEDGNEYFFAPVRTQTGNLHIVNENNADLEDLLPINNVDRPMKLVRLSDNAVVWQGFLNSSMFTQEYTGKAHTVDIPVNGVLEAMKSIHMKGLNIPQFACERIAWWLNEVASLLAPLNVSFDIPSSVSYMYTDYSSDFPVTIEQRLEEGVYLQTGAIFEEKEEHTYDGTIYVKAESISCHDVIENICKLFGFVAREEGETIHMEICDDISKYAETSAVRVPMDGLIYMGSGHTQSVKQGAHSVEVRSEVRDNTKIIDLPEPPAYPDLKVVTQNGLYCQLLQDKRQTRTNFTFSKLGATVSISPKRNAYSVGAISVRDWNGLSNTTGLMGQSGARILVDNYTESDISGTIYAGACFGLVGESVGKDGNASKGIFTQFIPIQNESQIASWGVPIMAVNSVIDRRYNDTGNTSWSAGFFRLSGEFGSVMGVDTTSFQAEKYTVYDKSRFDKLSLYVRVYLGDECIIGETAPMPLKLDGNGKFGTTYQIPMIGPQRKNAGRIRVEIYPYIKDDGYADLAYGDAVTEGLLSTLMVEYVPAVNVRYFNDTDNIYRKVIGTGFEQEVSILSNLATNYDNEPSDSEIVNQDIVAIKSMRYKLTGENKDERPEINTLNRLEAYYSKKRRIKELIVKLDGNLSLPKTVITGYDGRTYMPLSSSIDWHSEINTIRCFEVPD